ncbi:MAG: hypothetical protein ACWGMZ_10740, partial [Thermoguttaceae bacterium]
MPLKYKSLLFLVILLYGISCSMLSAAEMYGWNRGHYRGPVPYYLYNPKLIEVSPIYTTGARQSTYA